MIRCRARACRPKSEQIFMYWQAKARPPLILIMMAANRFDGKAQPPRALPVPEHFGR